MALPFDLSDMKKETVHSEKGLKVELINSLSDAMRQHEEKNLSAISRQADMLTNDVANKLIAFIKTLKTDKVELTTIGKNLQKNDDTNQFDGSIDFTFKVLHSGLTKDLNLKIQLKNNSFDMPNGKVLMAELEKTTSYEDKIETDLKKEMDDNINAITASVNEPLEKEAQMYTSIQPHPVLHIQKTWLPSSLKMGDIINLQGSLYKIVSDDHNKMSSGSDGIFWTLREVSETSDGKNSEITAS